jgi:hypothetical protein
VQPTVAIPFSGKGSSRVWSLAGITTADKKLVHSIAQKQKICYHDQSSNQVGGCHRGIFITKASLSVVAPPIPGWQLGKN